MIDVGSVGTENTNLTSGALSGADDHSYSRFPIQTAASDDTPTMSFGDFLDMVNPLQHIPVVSTVYRAVTGTTINPVSRIAGDALYGAAFGLASAGISALGAIGDEIYSANNDGHGGAATLVAALFDTDDKSRSVQLASNDVASPSSDAALAVSDQKISSLSEASSSDSVTPMLQPSPAQGSFSPPPAAAQNLSLPVKVASTPLSSAPSLSAATESVIAGQSPSPPVQAAPPAQASVAQSLPVVPTPVAATSSSVSPGMPLDRSKQAYGGVMDTAMMQTAEQNQALALAIAGGRSTLQAQHAMRNNRFAINTTPPPTSEPVPVSSSTSPTTGSNAMGSNATGSLTTGSNTASAISAAFSSPSSNNSDLLARANLAASASAVAPVPVLSSAAQNALTPPLPSMQGTLAQTSLASSSKSSGLFSTANAPASMQSMIGHLRSMKGLAQYRSTAQSVPPMGASVDVMN